jgi:hypothetical protein
MAVSYTKEQEELLRKMRGDSAFPDAYNPPSLLGTTPLVNPQPTRNPLSKVCPPRMLPPLLQIPIAR